MQEQNLDEIGITFGQRRHIERIAKEQREKYGEQISEFFRKSEGAFKTHQKEVSKIFEEYSKSVAESVNETSKATTTQVNEALAAINKRFSGMYSTLINTFLVKQESKVFANECAVHSLAELVQEEISAITGKPVTEETKMAFAERLQTRMASVAEAITVEAEARMKEEQQRVEEAAKSVDQAQDAAAETGVKSE